AAQDLPERLSIHELHGDVEGGVRGADVVNRDDVRMAQRRGGSGFLLEALAAVGVRGELAGQHLDGDLAAQPRIPCAVDLSHASGAQRREDLEGPKPGTRRQRHVKNSDRILTEARIGPSRYP